MLIERIFRRGLLLLLLPFMLAACEKAPQPGEATEKLGFSADAGTIAGRAIEATAGKRVALTHRYGLSVPGNEMAAVQQRHIDACLRLGCTVLNSRLDRPNARLNAYLSVRIAPDRYEAFLTTLMAAPAEVISHAESAEDQTVTYLDVEKRLESKLALRDKLIGLLRDPASKTVADLVAIEKELAQVQGEIEAATARRDYLRTITETIRVDVSYEGTGMRVAGFDLMPIHWALKDFKGNLISSVGALISFIAVVIPWLPVFALVTWALRYGIRRWKARKKPA